MDDRPHIILSPHYDDAVLSLGGMIASAPQRAVVVTVFAGTPADAVAGHWDRRSGFATAAAAMQARREENRAALAVIGVPQERICDLDFLDRQYRGRDEADAAARGSLRTEIGDAIKAVVGRHGGAATLFAPASAWHPDHGLVGDALLAAYAGDTDSAVDICLYQDQPYTYLELRRRRLIPLKFIDFSILDRILQRRSELAWQREFVALEVRSLSLKMRSIEKYASQFPVIRRLLCKMIRDFSHYQARAAGVPSPHVEVVYRLHRG